VRPIRRRTVHHEWFDGHACDLPLVLKPGTEPAPCECEGPA
jgi:hypothetical protein